MFDVGLSELMVIGLVALLVIGPEKLPRVARTLGALLGRLQRHVAEVKADISREIQLDEMKRLQAEVSQQAQDLSSSIQAQAREFEASMRPLTSGLQASVAADSPPPPPPLAPPDPQPPLPLVAQALPESAAAPVAGHAEHAQEMQAAAPSQPDPQLDFFAASPKSDAKP